MGKIKLGLTDDHLLFRRGLASILATYEQIQLVLQTSSGPELLEQLQHTELDVVLLDLEMPEMNGIQTAEALREQYPDLKILILSMYDDDHFIQHLMEVGANGYLLKDAEPDEVVQAVVAAAKNGFYFSERVSKVVLQGLANKKKVKPIFRNQVRLTKRELQVLQLICEEQTNNEIGEQLFLSPRTIEGYRNRLLEKTGVRNTAGLVVFAIRNELFQP